MKTIDLSTLSGKDLAALKENNPKELLQFSSKGGTAYLTDTGKVWMVTTYGDVDIDEEEPEDTIEESIEDTTEETTPDAAKEISDEMREMITKVEDLDGVQIEICGTWLWLTGNTYPNKDSIKLAGFRYSRNKQSWYWHPGEYHRWTNKNPYTMSEIRATYGSEKIQRKEME